MCGGRERAVSGRELEGNKQRPCGIDYNSKLGVKEVLGDVALGPIGLAVGRGAEERRVGGGRCERRTLFQGGAA